MAAVAKETGWKNHTIRGFMAGAMKKAGVHNREHEERRRGALAPDHPEVGSALLAEAAGCLAGGVCRLWEKGHVGKCRQHPS